jgi:DNA-binding MarR family transcriptional regulator
MAASKGASSARADDDESPDPSLGKVLDFMRLLWSLAHGLDSMSKRMAVDLGVTGPQRLVVRIVGRFPGISAGELAELMHLHPSTLTGVLARLHERNLITRRVHTSDRRRQVLRLTARGKRLDAERAGTAEAAVRAALSSVSPRHVQAATEVLRALVRELDERS